MRETQFIEQNKEKWEQVEHVIRKKVDDPALIRENFIQLTDDLSYSRTFYKNRSVRVYLNQLAQGIYTRVYKNRKSIGERVKDFWVNDIPALAWQGRQDILLSFIVVLLAAIIGYFCCEQDPGFARSILGDAYVERTLDNIESGDPLGIYKSSSAAQMFWGIGINNLRVAFIMFIMGLFFGLGTFLMLIYNGIMLGTFMQFFYSRGLSLDFNFTVWLHGTLEILGMVIEGAAGFALARGIIAPGTFSRARSMQFSARRAIKLFLACVPIIILAAFIESFITRYTNLHIAIRGTVIAFSLFFMVYYFVIYPYRRFKNKPIETEPDKAPLDQVFKFALSEIHKNGVILVKAINDLKFLFKYFPVALILTVCMWLMYKTFFYDQTIGELYFWQQSIIYGFGTFVRNIFKEAFNALIILNFNGNWYHYLTTTLFVSAVSSVVLWLSRNNFDISITPLKFFIKCIISAAVPWFAVNLLLMVEEGFFIFIYLISLPFAMNWIACNAIHKTNVFDGLLTSTRYFFSTFSRVYGAFVISIGIQLMLLVFAASIFWYLFVNILSGFFEYQSESFRNLIMNFQFGFDLILLICGIGIFTLQFTYLSYTQKEITEAAGLFKRIDELGHYRKMYGMEGE